MHGDDHIPGSLINRCVSLTILRVIADMAQRDSVLASTTRHAREREKIASLKFTTNDTLFHHQTLTSRWLDDDRRERVLVLSRETQPNTQTRTHTHTRAERQRTITRIKEIVDFHRWRRDIRSKLPRAYLCGLSAPVPVRLTAVPPLLYSTRHRSCSNELASSAISLWCELSVAQEIEGHCIYGGFST